jgi:UDP-GlcNAc:undecaprenyl-phosphate GlcNAc-1-phosphate transferase
MVNLCLGLIPLALLISLVVAAVLVRVGHRLQTFDSAGVPGQVKVRRRVPNTGGIAIVIAFILPMLVLISFVKPVGESSLRGDEEWREFSLVPEDLRDHAAGLAEQAPLAYLFIASVLLLHVMGVIDDRRPLGAWPKLIVMLIPCIGVPLITTLSPTLSDTRLLTAIDAHVGGAWLSILITAAWLLVITNAMNFMDNMDGLSAGVGCIAASCLLAAAIHNEQWFVGATLALLVGALIGFLVFNAPRKNGAKLFMGDGGSLVLGFSLAFLTTRGTYVPTGAIMTAPGSNLWWAPLAPLLVLAIPLYDAFSVMVLRVRQGRSPLVGDLQHFSHRLVDLGLTRARAVYVIWGFALVTGLSGVAVMATLSPWAAAAAWGSTLALLAVLAMLEFSARGALDARGIAKTGRETPTPTPASHATHPTPAREGDRP